MVLKGLEVGWLGGTCDLLKAGAWIMIHLWGALPDPPTFCSSCSSELENQEALKQVELEDIISLKKAPKANQTLELTTELLETTGVSCRTIKPLHI